MQRVQAPVRARGGRGEDLYQLNHKTNVKEWIFKLRPTAAGVVSGKALIFF